MRLWPRSLRVRLVSGVVLVAAVVALAMHWRGGGPELPTTVVTRGDFVEVLETRGEIRPVRSIVITAPFSAGELVILELSPTGTFVKKGDPVAKFDALTLRRTVQDKQLELRNARAETAEAAQKLKIQEQADATAHWRAGNDVQRAKLDVGDPTILSVMGTERARLSVEDAQQRLIEAEVKLRAARRTTEADLETRQRKIAKIEADLAYAERAIQVLEVTAPADGTVSVMPNYRTASSMGSSYSDFRPGDRAYPGAQILELPDLSSVHLTARIDEADRGQLKVAQTAAVRLDAIPDREYEATVDDISLLARVDYSSWPPTKNFDLRLSIVKPDDRLRPGMSAVARIAIGRVPDMLLAPAAAVFTSEGRTVVYRRAGRRFEEVPVEVLRRGRDQVALKGVADGDHLALTRPAEFAEERP